MVLSSVCEQCHIDSRRRKLNMRLSLSVFWLVPENRHYRLCAECIVKESSAEGLPGRSARPRPGCVHSR